MSDLWTSIAIGVAVPVVVLLGPSLPYLIPRRSDFRRMRADEYERFGRDVAEGMAAGFGVWARVERQDGGEW